MGAYLNTTVQIMSDIWMVLKCGNSNVFSFYCMFTLYYVCTPWAKLSTIKKCAGGMLSVKAHYVTVL